VIGAAEDGKPEAYRSVPRRSRKRWDVLMKISRRNDPDISK